MLDKAGVPNASFEAELLASYAADINRAALVAMMRDPYPPEAKHRAADLCRRRAAHEPFAYITGHKEFYGIDFQVTPDVLIPRPETEALVDAAVSLLPEGGSFLDLCCGSGAVAVALKHCRNDASVSASDISQKALAVAGTNADTLLWPGAVTFIVSDLFDAISGRYDLIAANPPYVGEHEKALLAAELDYEPQIALFSAEAGFFHTGQIIRQARDYLNAGGYLIVETNPALRTQVTDCARDCGYSLSVENDLAGFPRFYLLQAV